MNLSSDCFFSADKVIEYLFDISLKDDLIFRGIKRDIEKLPKIMRVWRNNNSNDMSKFEISILKEFIRHSSSLINGNLNPIDLVSYAQHFGLPTRLIDWTRNPFIALYFAINGQDVNETKTYQILVMSLKKQVVLNNIFSSNLTLGDIQYSDLHTSIDKYIRFLQTINEDKLMFPALNAYANYQIDDSDMATKEFYEMKGKIENNCFLVLDLNYSNSRIITQQGIFILPRRLTKSLIEKQYEKSGVGTILIDKSLKNDLLFRLDRLGINKRRLFFDLESICTDIVDSVLK